MTNKYGVTTKVIDMVHDLILSGYSGSANIVAHFPSVHKEELDGCLAIELIGFSKETVFLTEGSADGEIHMFGRYKYLGTCSEVKDVVSLAWEKYKAYKDWGYALPVVFEDLFFKYGYIKRETVTIIKEVV